MAISSRSTDKGSWDFHGDTSGSIGFLSASADANANGSHNSMNPPSSTCNSNSAMPGCLTACRSKPRAKRTRFRSAKFRRASTSRANRKITSRSSSREFTNHNQCHAVTFLFYRINKIETIKFKLVAIERRVIDPVDADARAGQSDSGAVGQIATIAQELPATNLQRVAAIDRSIESDRKVQAQAIASLPRAANVAGLFVVPGFGAAAAGLGDQTPLADTLRDKAAAFVDEQLVKQGLLDKVGGVASPQAKTEIGYERRTSIPTAGVIVKTCMDNCSACEPELEKKIDLELQRLDLQNKLLAKQIELLEKSQEYRCCPAGESDDDN